MKISAKIHDILLIDPSDNNLVKRKRGRQPASQNKSMTTSQDSQESLKPIAKDGPNRQCSLCSKEKQESLIACRDCTVRGMYIKFSFLCENN